MPPEAIIKALQERVNRQRMLKEKFEGELEAIVQAETERAFANLDEDKRASRRPAVPSRHRRDSCSSDELVGGLWSKFEAIRTESRPRCSAQAPY